MRGFTKIDVPRQRLADRVYEQILTALSDGVISPKERIVQESLAEVLQISRTPIREALLRLEREGVLETTARGGWRLRMPPPNEVREIYQAREAIEGYCARLLATERNADKFDAIELIIRRNEGSEFENVKSIYEANRLIHRSFVELSDNKYLLEMFDVMWNRSLSFIIFSSMERESLDRSLSGHMELCQALRDGDPDASERAMRGHIADGLQLQLAALKHGAA
jgi:DNA-binding GntR family transcriptional regulator